MSKGKDLLLNTGILFLAKASTQAISFLLLPLYTGLLTTAQYGQLDLYSSLVMIILPIVTLQIEQGIFRFLVGDTQIKTRTTTLTTALITLLISSAFVTLIYIAAASIFRFQYSLLLFLYYFSMMLSSVWYQICRGFGKNSVYGFATFLISLATILFNILFIVVFHMGVDGVLVSTTIAHLLGSIYMFLRTHTYKYFKTTAFDSSLSRELLRYSIPLIFNQISSWIINYSDRIIILHYLGISINGIYSVANKFSNILLVFFNVFNLAWTENVIKNLNDPGVSIYANRIISLTIYVYFEIVSILTNCLPLVFNIFVNERFDAAYSHIPILLLSAVFSGISASLGSVYVAHKKTKSVGITTTIAGLINVIVHLVLIRSIGLYAASVSTLVSFFSLFAYRYINIQSFFHVNIDKKICLPAIITFLISCCAYYCQQTIMFILALSINCLQLVLFIKNYRKELMDLIRH